MTPAAIIIQAHRDGVELALTPHGTIRAHGEQAAVERWVPLLREHKPSLVDYLKAGPDPEAERRRNKVLAMLASDPGLRYAVAVTDPDSDPVHVAVGIRNTATFELDIPRACYDLAGLLALLNEHSGPTP